MDPYAHNNSLDLPRKLSCHKRTTTESMRDLSQWSRTSSGGSSAQILRIHLDLTVAKKEKRKVYIFLPIKKTPSSGCCWETQSQHWTSVMSTPGLVLKPSVARLKWHLAMMAEGSCLSLQHCSTACCAAKIASIALEGHMLHSSCSISTCWTSVTLPAEFKVHGSQRWNEKRV